MRLGDPTELAFLDFAVKYGYRKEDLERKTPRVDERAFDSERKRMTTVHGKGAEKTAYCKGAADELVDLCTSVLVRGKEMPFSTRAKRKRRQRLTGWQERRCVSLGWQ